MMVVARGGEQARHGKRSPSMGPSARTQPVVSVSIFQRTDPEHPKQRKNGK